MRNKKTIKEFRAFYIMASSVYAKSSRKRKSGVIVQCNKKHGRPSSELEKTLTAAVMKWLEKHSLKPDFYESISSVQAHGIDDYFKKK